MSETVTLDDVWKAFRETDRMMREMREEMREMREERDRKMLEMDEETNLKIKQVSTQIGQLGSRLGEFVEGLVRPACVALFKERGFPVDEVFSRVEKVLNGQKMEIDLLVADTVIAIPIEVKSRLTVEDVRKHIKRLGRFKTFFPRYASCQIYGAVAGMVIDTEADRFAMKRGLFVIAQKGDTVKLANQPDFVPRSW
ncbi:MAG: hypothetical protein H7839_09315 [Magnetococcus sp. YQC-5]